MTSEDRLEVIEAYLKHVNEKLSPSERTQIEGALNNKFISAQPPGATTVPQGKVAAAARLGLKLKT